MNIGGVSVVVPPIRLHRSVEKRWLKSGSWDVPMVLGRCNFPFI